MRCDLCSLFCTAGSLPNNLVGAFAPGSVFSLDLSANRLSGTLPDAWGYSQSLFDRFNISLNTLGGSIPNSWANLMLNSSSFDISRLQLSGQLPTTLRNVCGNGTM